MSWRDDLAAAAPGGDRAGRARRKEGNVPAAAPCCFLNISFFPGRCDVGHRQPTLMCVDALRARIARADRLASRAQRTLRAPRRGGDRRAHRGTPRRRAAIPTSGLGRRGHPGLFHGAGGDEGDILPRVAGQHVLRPRASRTPTRRGGRARSPCLAAASDLRRVGGADASRKRVVFLGDSTLMEIVHGLADAHRRRRPLRPAARAPRRRRRARKARPAR